MTDKTVSEPKKLISSKDVLAKTGISRVTLHNYIKLGLLPRPIVGPSPDTTAKTRKIGYFPPDVIETIHKIARLKKRGYRLSSISEALPKNGHNETPEEIEEEEETMKETTATPLTFINAEEERRYHEDQRNKYGHITEIGYPAYMVNRKWEIEWVNESAEELFFGHKVKDLPTSEERNLFRLLLKKLPSTKIANLKDFIGLNAEMASVDIPSPAEHPTLRSLSNNDLALLNTLWTRKDPSRKTPIEKRPFTLNHLEKGKRYFNLIVSAFREGTLLLLVPQEVLLEPVVDMLMGRERVIRDLLLRKMPSFCSLCVLVADLQNSVKISADLPPAEYFELVSQIWTKMEITFRRFHGTQGKHVGDGVVRFFLAEPESPHKHVLNGLMCANEIKTKLAEINSEWKIRKKWTNELCFNVGIHEGREWFGYIPVNQFTALGDTVNIAGRLSDFSRNGAVWTSKHLISLLPPEIQKKLVFGIRRSSPQGEVFVPNTFSRVMDLVDLTKPENTKFIDISTFSITELVEIDPNLFSTGL
ncbi:MAG: MerR family transcriptional regulator [Deltaproteobacteria bacterium]|nr:MerR family transcriptional regulator [Deltaproteobacteria bacterium]